MVKLVIPQKITMVFWGSTLPWYGTVLRLNAIDEWWTEVTTLGG